MYVAYLHIRNDFIDQVLNVSRGIGVLRLGSALPPGGRLLAIHGESWR